MAERSVLGTLTVPGELGSLGTIGEFILKAAEAAKLDKKATYRLRLAVDEMATNSIVHGYDETGLQGNVYVSAEIDDRSLFVYLEDTAPAYDPTKRPEPDDLDEPLEDREIGGLGIYLALEGVDSYEYEYVNGRNRSTFMMLRP